MRVVVAIVLAAAVSLVPAAARARERTWKGGPVHPLVEAGAGVLLLQNEALRDRYPDAVFTSQLRVGAGFEPYGLRRTDRFPYVGTFAVSVEGGFSVADGEESIAPNPDLQLFLIPFAASVEWSWRKREDPWLVPFVAGGFMGVWFREEIQTTPEDDVSGVRWGWHGDAGLRLSLDRIDPTAASNLYEFSGITASWLSIRGRYQFVEGFDEGIVLSGVSILGSFMLEW